MELQRRSSDAKVSPKSYIGKTRRRSGVTHPTEIKQVYCDTCIMCNLFTKRVEIVENIDIRHISFEMLQWTLSFNPRTWSSYYASKAINSALH